MEYVIKDYLEQYGKVMDFNKNKSEYIHRWYPFVEGYSEMFIKSILEEQNTDKIVCLDPFCGSGTTPLEMQKRNLKCFSFEVNPFLYLVSTVKMSTKYEIKTLQRMIDNLKASIENTDDASVACYPQLEKKFLVESDVGTKWNFNKEVYTALVKLRLAIDRTPSLLYRNLFLVVYASILLPVSNLYRNGKCLSYKKDWKLKERPLESFVFEQFWMVLKTKVIPDITELSQIKKSQGPLYSNKDLCCFGDVRVLLDKKIENATIDLVITSPPYLNSRDYTDIYILELWMLGLVKTHKDVRSLREKTLRSHVQLNWSKTSTPIVDQLQRALVELEAFRKAFWNDKIPDMISGYFTDMQSIFRILNKKMVQNGKVYFNVANSAYYGTIINVDEICACLAEQEGFYCEEIRTARWLKSSGQQKNTVNKLRESVLVLRKI